MSSRRLVNMRLPVELLECVDRLARERGVSRTALVEVALERVLAEEPAPASSVPSDGPLDG